MDPKTLAKAVVNALDSKKARDVRILQVTDLTVLADFFIIATGTSSTHIKTMVDEVEFSLKEQGVTPHHIEGHLSGNWLLLDYGAVVVHVFSQDTRAFYSIERLWSDAKVWSEEEL